MTLIVCLKALDCVVMAADSLTTRGRTVTSCTTVKLHRIGVEAVTAGCGLSQVMGQDWGTVLSQFPLAASGTPLANVAADLKAFLEAAIARFPRNNVGATQGGNEFLLSGHDAAGPGVAVTRLVRKNMDYLFQAPVPASPATAPSFIEWIGDRASVEGHIVSTNARYAPGMTEAVAIDFAVTAIRDGILASIVAGNHTIGGDFVDYAVVRAGSATRSRVPSGVTCIVPPPAIGPAKVI